MKKLLTSSMTATLMISFSVSASLADNTSPTSAQAPSKPEHVSKVKAVAGFFAGIVVGTPVCFIRKLPIEIKDGGQGLAQSFVPDTNNKLWLVPATVAWAPFATVAAAIESPAWAVRHAWDAQKPFSKEQFSLDWLEQAQNQPSK